MLPITPSLSASSYLAMQTSAAFVQQASHSELTSASVDLEEAKSEEKLATRLSEVQDDMMSALLDIVA